MLTVEDNTVTNFVYGLSRGQLLSLALMMDEHSEELQETISNALTDLQGTLEQEARTKCNETDYRISLIDAIIEGSVETDLNKLYNSDTINLKDALSDTRPIL